MADHAHSHAPADLGTRLMAMSAGRRVLSAAVGVALLWLAVWWALAFDARSALATSGGIAMERQS
ncbi:MAG TPA: hypothetical protein VJ890_05100 [Vineibacter sp.]|nr:hypothetical protein [Vineibacter sp.]